MRHERLRLDQIVSRGGRANREGEHTVDVRYFFLVAFSSAQQAMGKLGGAELLLTHTGFGVVLPHGRPFVQNEHSALYETAALGGHLPNLEMGAAMSTCFAREANLVEPGDIRRGRGGDVVKACRDASAETHETRKV